MKSRLSATREKMIWPKAGHRGVGRGLAITFRALRHRNYRLYFFGQLVSVTGSWMQTTALMWLAFDLRHQSLWPALMAAGQVVPTVLVGIWGGMLADRRPKRALIFQTQAAFMVLALVLAGLALGGCRSPWPYLIVTAAGGLVQAIDLPARLAFVSDMAGRQDLINAVALNSLLFNLARVLGPAWRARCWYGLGLDCASWRMVSVTSRCSGPCLEWTWPVWHPLEKGALHLPPEGPCWPASVTWRSGGHWRSWCCWRGQWLFAAGLTWPSCPRWPPTPSRSTKLAIAGC